MIQTQQTNSSISAMNLDDETDHDNEAIKNIDCLGIAIISKPFQNTTQYVKNIVRSPFWCHF